LKLKELIEKEKTSKKSTSGDFFKDKEWKKNKNKKARDNDLNPVTEYEMEKENIP
jgi:hypothetical protein